MLCLPNAGYMNEDCSVSQGQVPEIQNLDPATCDVSNVSCSTVSLQAIRVSSGDLVCQFKVSKPTVFCNHKSKLQISSKPKN